MAIDIKRFEEIVSNYPQLKMEPMSAFYKIESGDGRIYVAKTKRVSRVDISGFHFTHPAMNILDQDLRKEKRKGRVEAQLNFTKSDDQVLDAFETGLKFMLAISGIEGIDLPSKLQKEADHFTALRPPRVRRAPTGPEAVPPQHPGT
jgi:hypothetical protein